jgi:hypothetical protein
MQQNEQSRRLLQPKFVTVSDKQLEQEDMNRHVQDIPKKKMKKKHSTVQESKLTEGNATKLQEKQTIKFGPIVSSEHSRAPYESYIYHYIT